ncbi:MAG TPA: adenylate/guanylate cyclase domain-containing protein, partial [Chroococcidiopsis sp.]
QVSDNPSPPGHIRFTWQQGTLLFTDLAGFTPLLEANAAQGRRGAAHLLKVLNHYFSEMIEIISKSGGDLLEFTGDAMLVQFLADAQRSDVAQAVRAGLRMQRAMEHFSNIEAANGQYQLGMRVGVHSGRFLTADIGTPIRMAHVLLGKTVQQAKQAEGSGKVGRVCLSKVESDRLGEPFRYEPTDLSYMLVNDDFSADQLGEYDITLSRRRQSGLVLLDRSAEGLLLEINEAVKRVEVLAGYVPSPILRLLVESASQRRIPPNFPESIVVFVNLLGLPESVDAASQEELDSLVRSFSRAFSSINAAVSSRGGILQKVTYQLVGSDILVYFGVLTSRTDDALRAADTAIAIREIVNQLPTPLINDKPINVACRIGITRGAVFAAEIGEPRGRREFNILGDPVNTAARLMTRAAPQQILMTEEFYEAIAPQFSCEALGKVFLKGKAAPVGIYSLQKRAEE